MIDIIETTRMSTRGQVIIPKGIREYIHAEEDTIFTVMPLDKDSIIMKKLDKKKLINEFRDIRKSIKERLTPEEISHEVESSRKKN